MDNLLFILAFWPVESTNDGKLAATLLYSYLALSLLLLLLLIILILLL